MVGPLISYTPYKLSSKIRNLHKNSMIALYVLYVNGAETNCGIAHILRILLMSSCNTDIFFSNYYHLQSVRFEYVTRTVRKPLKTTKLMRALPGRFTWAWARAKARKNQLLYWVSKDKLSSVSTCGNQLIALVQRCQLWFCDDEVFFCCTQLAFAG